MRCATDTSLLESIGHWVECWGIIFWVLSRTVVQNGEFRHKPSTVNCFNYLWSDVKQEPREQLKFLDYWLNSVISYKHRWLDRSFSRMKIIQCFSELKENSLNSLPHILKLFFFLFQGRKLIGIVIMFSDVSKRRPWKHTIIALQCKYYRTTVSQNVT